MLCTPKHFTHAFMCNIVYNIELVSFIYNVSRLMLTINMLLLLMATVQNGQSILICLYWFKGFRFRCDGGLAHTYAHIGVTWATWRAPSHWPPTVFCHSKNTDKHICSCSSVLTKHVMHLRLHLTLWAHSPMYHPPLGEGWRACDPIQKSVFNEGFV